MFVEQGSRNLDWRNNPKVPLLGIDEKRQAACVGITEYTSWMHTAGRLPDAKVVISGITNQFEFSVPITSDSAKFVR